MANDLFEPTGNPGEQDDQDKETIDSYMEYLVGDGKKFKDVEALAKGKYTSDIHIRNLEDENKELIEQLNEYKNEVQKRDSVEETLDKWRSERNASSSDDLGHQPGDQRGTEDNTSDNRSLTIEDVESFLEERNSKATKKSNFEYVVAELKKRYGSDYKQVLAAKADELSVGTEFLNSLAETQPKVFLELVGDAQTQSPSQTVPHGNVDTNRFSGSPKGGPTRYSYWKKLRKENPGEYRRRYHEMMQMNIQEGDAFMDG